MLSTQFQWRLKQGRSVRQRHRYELSVYLLFEATWLRSGIKLKPNGTCQKVTTDGTTKPNYTTKMKILGAWITQLAERPTFSGQPQYWVPGAARYFFSQSQLPVQTVLRCPYRPRVQSLASTSTRTLKTPNTGSHTVVWPHGNNTHTDGNG